jgi:hypothetical protein
MLVEQRLALLDGNWHDCTCDALHSAPALPNVMFENALIQK